MSELLSVSLRLSPAVLRRNQFASFFQSLPDKSGEDWKVDGVVNQKLRLLAQLSLHRDGQVRRLHYC